MQRIEINENGIHMVLEIIRSQEEKHAFLMKNVNTIASVDMVNAFGAAAAPMGFGEVYTAI
ncbi:hypothetical protein, partial [Enterocloster clostridioformis]|uniref:hypothetical protein n=1 Tax=Enterocloster clostridioformis TaxID=1531 RepID=UPI0023300B31